MSGALVETGSRTRTQVVLPISGDPWPTITAWAKQHRFLPRAQTDASRSYQRGTGLLTAPMKLDITVDGEQLRLAAWVHVPTITRVCSLFLLPREMRIASGGVLATVPRRIARNAVNELLGKLGGPAIP